MTCQKFGMVASKCLLVEGKTGSCSLLNRGQPPKVFLLDVWVRGGASDTSDLTDFRASDTQCT